MTTIIILSWVTVGVLFGMLLLAAMLILFG